MSNRVGQFRCLKEHRNATRRTDILRERDFVIMNTDTLILSYRHNPFAMWLHRQSPSLIGYSLAVLSTVVALLLRWLLMPVLGTASPYILFYPAIAVSSWYGGLQPGLLATGLSAFLASYFLLLPFGSLHVISSADWLSLTFFVLIGVLISVLNESLHRARQSVEAITHQLGESNERFHLLVESVRDYGIFMLDGNGHIISWNAGAQRIKGYQAEEIIGRHFSVFYPPEDLENGKPEMELRVATAEGRYEEEGWRVRKDGSQFWANVVITAVRDDLGELRGFAKVTRDITERKRAEDAWRESEERLQAILDNTTTVSVYVKDTEGRYLMVNRGFEEAYGHARDEIIGHTDYELTTPAFADAFRTHDQRILTLDAPIRVEEETKTHDGRLVTYLSSKFPLRDAEGRAYAVCGISVDISNRKQAEKEIARLLGQEQAARAEAEAANQAKDEFLSVLSHELRTPLTAIMGWVGLLRMGRLDAATVTQGLEAIERSTQLQVRLVEDLLDVSRIVAGDLAINPVVLPLASLIEGVVNAMRPTAEAKEVHLAMHLDRETGEVWGDPNRLQQVIWNLLSNGIKFTPRGGQVQVQLGKSGSHARIVVSDTGEGIRPELLPHVFKRFWQADSTSTRPHGGLGVGLTIVHHIVELHGGTVRADSAGEGQGATFTVDLPLITTEIHSTDGMQKVASITAANT